jgi:hypothetical protein
MNAPILQDADSTDKELTMSAVREKVRRLEQYLAVDDIADRVIEQTVDKLIEREAARLTDLKERLERQLAEFEKQYAMKTPVFYARFERGELGDVIDFVEWSATFEMVANLNKRLALLQEGVPR